MAKVDFYSLALKVAKIAESKKAIDTNVLDIQDLATITNYFVVTTAESTPQINAICDEIEKQFKEDNLRPLRREGISSQSWRVIDFGGIIVHVMSPAARNAYNFEKVWRHAKVIKPKEIENKKVVKKVVQKKTTSVSSKSNKK
ncbi:MAG: ribosome silencing factor [Endomicrobium sp.]|nr:ribosome silencing factor [Endomicrobium sp.]